MADQAREDITSAGDLPSTYSLMRPPQRKPTGLPADYSDQHGFNLPGRAEEHMSAPGGVYSAEKSLDRYGGDGDDDGSPPQDDKKSSSSGSSSSDDDDDDDDDDD